ncbi:unnamed protein product [Paramecium sonneborni]|uniref:Uncharacterized protein n=1 Tax=Paramecium sonneborni TaxID=65129 RepID=A0A8S1M6C2_9CILI|nr:unnamed protein product [Paramecium sonneborni]
MIFLIVILVQQIFGFSELIYSFDASIDGLQGWVGKSYIFNEHNVKLYGGNSPTIRRIFLNLNPHYQIKIEMEFWLTNNQSSGSLQMQIDDLLILNKLYNNATLVDVNGPTHFDQYYDVITIVQPQKRRTAFLQIVITELIQCGIRTLKFYIERCPLECEVCDNFDYLDCYKWKLYKLAFNQYQFQNLQGWSTKIERTFQTINFCAQCHFLNQEGVNFNGVLPSHKGIILRFFRLGTLISQTININGYINTIAQSTQSSLIELIIKNHYEVNLFISIQTASIRDFEFYYQLEDQYSIPLMLNCHQYINSICVNCLDGWELNEFQNLCNPYCGNQIIQDLEQCDDGNEIPNDGCFQCQFQCDIHCAICYFGICQKCEIGYLIANDQNIFPQCLLEIIDSDEICINHCIVCYKNQCQECEEGFTLNNGDCKSICGDGIIISEYEQCDDGNQIEFDGCYQCKYSCPLLCSNCFQGICIQQNQEEDQNLISSINHYCGDGLVQDQEECDDQNLNPYDGCYNCKIQINWICSQINIYSLSECAYRKIPLLSVSYLNMKMNKQYIRVEYSKTVPSKDLVSISKIIQIKILDLNSKSYYLNLIPILEVGQDFQNLKYLIEIEIFQLLDFRPILAINFNQISKKYTRRTIEFPNEEDDNNAPLNNHLNLTLQYPSYLNSQQINNSNLITNINGYIIQFLGAITGIQLLFGKSNQFLLILNILSYQQYLRTNSKFAAFSLFCKQNIYLFYKIFYWKI